MSPPPPAFTTHTPTLQEQELRHMLRSVNLREAAGPDGAPSKVLQACADQLAGIFIKIFNISLSKAIMPSCLKSATSIPVSKKPVSEDLGNCKPIALTSVIMKCFEKLVLYHIRASLPPLNDSYQCAYRANRSTEDAVAVATHSTDPPGTSRQLRADALPRLQLSINTIVSDVLVHKLLDLGLSSSICAWMPGTFSLTQLSHDRCIQQ